MKNIVIKMVLPLVAIIAAVSCDNVDEGYRIDYKETPAQFSVALLTPNRGAVSDSISFSVKVVSDYNIKSLVTITSEPGGGGTGYYIGDNTTDPFIDHAYGTIQPGTREIDVVYNYVVSQDSVDANIEFILVDEYGKKSSIQKLITVPSIVRYDSMVMYTNTSAKTDGFSTSDGTVYHNLPDYEELNVVNEAVQEALDIVFLANSDSSSLVAPYSGYFSSGMPVRNKTLFKVIEGVSSEEFEDLTSASLSEITELNDVKKGTTGIQNIKVGDIIGFRTDFASANPYHYGLLRINAIHPTIVDHYIGTSYLIEMDIVTQK